MINRFPATCACGAFVPAGKGEWRDRLTPGSSMEVVCMPCVGKLLRDRARENEDYRNRGSSSQRWRRDRR